MSRIIVTIKCLNDTDVTDERIEESSDMVAIDGWIYTFMPLPGSLFDFEMRELGAGEMLEYIWHDPQDFHKTMQAIIAANQFAFAESDWFYVVHTAWEERSWKDEDNWTGDGEWNSDYEFLGVADIGKLPIVAVTL